MSKEELLEIQGQMMLLVGLMLFLWSPSSETLSGAGFLELPVSSANEELICQVICKASNSALSGYHTTIEEVENLKLECNLSPRLEIAVGVRTGEKRMLHQIYVIFKERESEFNVLEYYRERRLKDLGLIGEQGEIIFWEPK